MYQLFYRLSEHCSLIAWKAHSLRDVLLTGSVLSSSMKGIFCSRKYCPVQGFCKNMNEPLGCLKQGIFFFFSEQDNYQIFKKCVPYKLKDFFREEGGSKFLRNICNDPPYYTEQHR